MAGIGSTFLKLELGSSLAATRLARISFKSIKTSCNRFDFESIHLSFMFSFSLHHAAPHSGASLVLTR
jgi:hypothetical protein